MSKLGISKIAYSGILVVMMAMSANATTIDFNDGVNGSSIGSFYAGLGVTFTNASWNDFACSGSCTNLDGLQIADGPLPTFQPKSNSPIILTFSSPVSFVSIFGTNVGENGARLDAFDSETGGSLLGFAQDNSIPTGGGVGATNNPLLSVSASGIRRVELYQPLNTTVEGLLFDYLTFTPQTTAVPESSSLAYLGVIGLMFMGYKLWARSQRIRGTWGTRGA